MSQFPIPDWATDVDTREFTDPALLAGRASKFERTIKRRNFLEYAAALLSVGLFGALFVFGLLEGEIVFVAGGALCTVCTMIVAWQLHKRGSYEQPLPEESCLEHLRSQYERQYHALRTVPYWYLGPLAIGVFGFYAIMIAKFTIMGSFAKALEGTLQPMLFTAAFFGFVWWLNWFAAGKLKRQIEQIDALN